jgi:hypothetical protein
MIPACFYCGQPVDLQARSTLRRVVGWERVAGVRASGKHGGSDIRLRERLDEYAHEGCVALERAGVGVKQETLL